MLKFYFTPNAGCFYPTTTNGNYHWRANPSGCWIDYQLFNSDETTTVVNNTFQITQEQYDNWGTDDSVILNYLAQSINVTIVPAPTTSTTTTTTP